MDKKITTIRLPDELKEKLVKKADSVDCNVGGRMKKRLTKGSENEISK